MDQKIEVGKHAVTVFAGPYVVDGAVTADGLAFAESVLGMSEDAKEVAADKFLGTYNETWSGGGNPELTREQFLGKLELDTVNIYDEIGAAEIIYRDGDMFGGHWIVVMFSDGKPEYASMRG